MKIKTFLEVRIEKSVKGTSNKTKRKENYRKKEKAKKTDHDRERRNQIN
jgi:hypothetical protein